ncbi:MAG: tRNA epoxyqueuosine(34) reductase QueG [Vicinamibacterales bacterium]
MSSLTSAEIKSQARVLGFDACGVAPAAGLPELGFLAEWIARGYAGGMKWLEESAADRADIRRVLPSARSVIVTATNYNTARPFSTECADRDRAHVARYAWGDDYHEVVGRRQRALLNWMWQQTSEPFYGVDYVDTGPVQERVFAQHAGIGWMGKNCCVIHQTLGSFLFLGVIVTSLELEYDAPALDQCGSCTLCLEACPTQALVEPHVLDARRCIAYLTIEHRGEPLPELVPAIGTHVYGCDVCQEVCPWNAVAPATDDPAWQPRPAWDLRTVMELDGMTDQAMRDALKGSAMTRARLRGLRRNIRNARTNVEGE